MLQGGLLLAEMQMQRIYIIKVGLSWVSSE